MAEQQPSSPVGGRQELVAGLRTGWGHVSAITQWVRGLQVNMESCSLLNDGLERTKASMSAAQQWPLGPDRTNAEIHYQAQILEMEGNLHIEVANINQMQRLLVDHMKNNVITLQQLMTQVLDVELISWKREQQLNGNGVPMKSNLDAIQQWCEVLAVLLWRSRQQASRLVTVITPWMDFQQQQRDLPMVYEDIRQWATRLLSILISSTLVVEKQPSQVLKTNTKITVTVRSLIGGAINIHMNPPSVTVHLLQEKQAQALLESPPTKIAKEVGCADILNNCLPMKYQANNRQLNVSFNNMQVSKVKRSEKKGSETVTDEKLVLLFETVMKADEELILRVRALSLPVVAIVHGNQEPQAWGTVSWDNAFGNPLLSRIPFDVPESVPWGVISNFLCTKFYSEVGGFLSEENLLFLAKKLFRTDELPTDLTQLNALPVSWSLFCKDHLPNLNDKKFSFWEWFYMTYKLTKDSFTDLWCANLVMGYVQKHEAVAMLSECPAGTFLIRFSETEPGGVTISWIAESGEVLSLEPLTPRALAVTPLANWALNLPDLRYLYPSGVTREDVFAVHYDDKGKKKKDGYVLIGSMKIVPFNKSLFQNFQNDVLHSLASCSRAAERGEENDFRMSEQVQSELMEMVDALYRSIQIREAMDQDV